MIFSTKQLHLLKLCTFSGFGELGFGETGGHHVVHITRWPLCRVHEILWLFQYDRQRFIDIL